VARPRKVSDDDVYAAAYRVMTRVGPADFTLDAIAREVGVTAGALVQRFGSKKALQLKLAEGAAEWTVAFVEQIRAQHKSPLAALRAYAECMAGLAETPAAYVRNLAYLLEDLSDPDVRATLARQGLATRAQLAALVQSAVDVGELSPAAKPTTLARTIEAILGGSMLSWAFYREGSSADWMRKDLDAILAPYRVKRIGSRVKG
jgi:AcrR family transcriptional regulator